jgi:hypothetical protein
MSKTTSVKFEGETRGRCEGGQSASAKCGTEKHDSPRSKGKTFGQDAKISRRVDDSSASLLDESKVGGKRSEPSAVAKVRSANNLRRDQNTNLGRGKSSAIVTD